MSSISGGRDGGGAAVDTNMNITFFVKIFSLMLLRWLMTYFCFVWNFGRVTVLAYLLCFFSPLFYIILFGWCVSFLLPFWWLAQPPQLAREMGAIAHKALSFKMRVICRHWISSISSFLSEMRCFFDEVYRMNFFFSFNHVDWKWSDTCVLENRRKYTHTIAQANAAREVELAFKLHAVRNGHWNTKANENDINVSRSVLCYYI